MAGNYDVPLQTLQEVATLEVLMITHNRLEYLKKALPSVLNQNFKDFALTIWDNGSDQETLDYLLTIKDLGVKLIINDRNDSLADVTSQVFLNSQSEFVGKVDSDTIVPPDWAERLLDAHSKYHFGFIGGFHFHKDDLNGIIPNIKSFNGAEIWQKHHIGGCSFIIRQRDFKGYSGKGVMGLSEYQAEMGLPNGYLWSPTLWVDHMEDSRSPHYINTPEYNAYKIKTRGMSLAKYQTGISNPNYLKENTL